MADRSWWSGARARNSSTGTAPAASVAGPSSSSQTNKHKHNPLSHMASYLSLGDKRKGSDPFRDADKFADAIDHDYPPLRRVDQVWHNPSMTQAIETLSCTMMANGSFEPIPTPLNSCVLDLIAGYRGQSAAIQKLEKQLEEEKKEHDSDCAKFQEMIDAHEKREDGYREEVRRLEKLIADTAEGVRAVIVARNNSVVDRDRQRWRQSLHESIRAQSIHEGQALEAVDAERDTRSGQQIELTRTTSCYRTIDVIPRRADDDNNDVRLSAQFMGNPAPRRRGATGRGSTKTRPRPNPKQPEPENKATGPAVPPNESSSSTSSGDSSPRLHNSAEAIGSVRKTGSGTPDSSLSLLARGVMEERARKALELAGIDSDAVDLAGLHSLPGSQESPSVKNMRKSVENAKAALREELKHRTMPDSAIADDDDEFVSEPPRQQRRHFRKWSFVPGDEAASFPVSVRNRDPAGQGTAAANPAASTKSNVVGAGETTKNAQEDVSNVHNEVSTVDKDVSDGVDEGVKGVSEHAENATENVNDVVELSSRTSVVDSGNGKLSCSPGTPDRAAPAEPVLNTMMAMSYEVPATMGDVTSPSPSPSTVLFHALASRSPSGATKESDAASAVAKERSSPKSSPCPSNDGESKGEESAPLASAVSSTASSASGEATMPTRSPSARSTHSLISSSSRTPQRARTALGRRRIVAAQAPVILAGARDR